MGRGEISGKHAQSHANANCSSVDDEVAQPSVTPRSEDLGELDGTGKKHKRSAKRGPIVRVAGTEGNSGGAENGKMFKVMRRASLRPEIRWQE
jgi:hypothetical protein